MSQGEKRHASQEKDKKEQRQARNLTVLESVRDSGSAGGCEDLGNISKEEKERIKEGPVGCIPKSDRL